MFDHGDELIIDSYRIPWLIWIQLVVMFLLILLFYFFSFDDHSPTSNHASSSSNNNTQEPRENLIIKEPGSRASREIERREDINETEGSSGKDETSDPHFRHAQHPCHFLGIAKQAFLKCLGLDLSSESSSDSNERRD
ncbi:hypothetical protein DCAR_0101301 [Daucus carota subsp. sativus]|uniref:Transmembrane protein n=1 Tax=Daucus carota subsp. sativus TaxID=79200 RepID=A0A166G9P0_DAUCS|nr:PREDICTED: uncharacterized protein LOC108208589 [Daucus carota subsp. sativus]WOG82139.1 hypothetical protein DCAR_0101301 [Daucus carota subsp. sativus]